MSADLFAEFGSFNSGSSQPKQNPPLQPTGKPATVQTTDPFAFLSSPTTRTASPQTFHAPSQTWSPTIQPQQSGPGSNSWSNLGAVGNTQQSAQESQDDEDGWGDFEEAPPSAVASKPPPSILNNNLPITKTGPMAKPELLSKPRIHRADTLDLMSNNLVQISGARKMEPWQDRPSWEKTKSATQKPSNLASKPELRLTFTRPKLTSVNSDVLFDADDFDAGPPEDGDEDDFGDFETGEVMKTPATNAPAPTPAQSSMNDLLSIDFGSSAPQSTRQPASTSLFVPAPAPAPSSARKQPPSQLLSTLNLGPPSPSADSLYPQPPRSPSFSERNPFPGLAVTTPVAGKFPKELKDDKEKSPTPITAWPEALSAKDKDDWDAFADFPPDASSTTPGGAAAFSSTWDWDAVDSLQPAVQRPASKSGQRKASHEETIGPPPTNVPPPSILLSILPELLVEADTKLYQPTAKQPSAVKSRIYADPATLDYVRSYLTLATVAARILAGRKLRWHRDKFLSQSMTISAAGSKGGMKLAGIDKTQSAREDREAADVVGVWRDHIGKLRSAVAAANIGIQKQPVKMNAFKVPDINDHMAVTTAKVVPTAPRPCVVCGLKRDERVKGVDIDVEDSFGEWWVEHWGHRACRNFWLGNEEKLRSR